MSPRPRPSISNDVGMKHRPRIEVAFVELARAGVNGLTYWELGKIKGLHHGQASAVLSKLHQDGTIERLQEKRGGCGVYVLSSLINGRPTVAHRSQRRATAEIHTKRLLDVLDRDGVPFEAVLEGSRGFLVVRYRPIEQTKEIEGK